MRRKSTVLRPLGLGMDEQYTRAEILEVCRAELFAPAKKMDAPLLLEALRALDMRFEAPDAGNAKKALLRRIREQRPRGIPRRAAVVLALALLLMAMAGTCVAWALRAGVLSFLSEVPDIPGGVPEVTDEAAEALVQRELASAMYPYCELRVREASFDGHQIRVVYSVRDTREVPQAIGQEEIVNGDLEAAEMSGIGVCDFLVADGQDVYLDDAYQLPGEEPGELLYYLAANVPQDVTLGNPLHVELPVGHVRGYGMGREQPNVCFELDASAAEETARRALPVSAQWGNTRVRVLQVEVSPMHALVRVEMTPADASQPYGVDALYLCAEDGTPLGFRWYTSWGGGYGGSEQITQYIPSGEWPQAMLLAALGADGRMDAERAILLEWEK